MTKDEAAKLAEGQDDEELAKACAKHGPLVLAVAWEGSPGTKSTDFSRENPFVHFAMRAGVVEAVTAEMAFPDGKNEPVTKTLFKGEK